MTYDALFNELVEVMTQKLWWYQGGAEDALRALLENRDKFNLLSDAHNLAGGIDD